MIENITTNTYQWLVTRATVIANPKKPAGVHEVNETIAFAA